jgi:LPXTG-motif cell wall-anchored protein
MTLNQILMGLGALVFAGLVMLVIAYRRRKS